MMRGVLKTILLVGLALGLTSATAHAAEPVLPLAAVGKVNYAGYSSRSTCTGVLVAPDRVLTAAHCLLASGNTLREPEEVHFVAGYDRGSYTEHALGRKILMAPGYLETNSKFKRFERDYAVIILERALDIPPVPLSIITDATVLNVIHAGYRHNRPEALTVTEPCLMLPRDVIPWASSCPTAGGSSGGPVFSIDKDGTTVSLAGIMIATMGKAASLAVPVTAWQDLVNSISDEEVEESSETDGS